MGEAAQQRSGAANQPGFGKKLLAETVKNIPLSTKSALTPLPGGGIGTGAFNPGGGLAGQLENNPPANAPPPKVYEVITPTLIGAPYVNDLLKSSLIAKGATPDEADWMIEYRHSTFGKDGLLTSNGRVTNPVDSQLEFQKVNGISGFGLRADMAKQIQNAGQSPGQWYVDQWYNFIVAHRTQIAAEKTAADAATAAAIKDKIEDKLPDPAPAPTAPTPAGGGPSLSDILKNGSGTPVPVQSPPIMKPLPTTKPPVAPAMSGAMIAIAAGLAIYIISEL